MWVRAHEFRGLQRPEASVPLEVKLPGGVSHQTWVWTEFMSSAAQALDYGDISAAPKVMFLKIISLVSLEGTFSIFFNDYLYSNCN